MTRRTKTVLIWRAVVALALLSALPATAQSSSNEKPKATEVGVTATEIHIAVIADVDNPFAPGLFKGAVDGVKAGAAYLNSKAGGGGLAGRKVVVDFYDSKLNGNESRNATIQGCQNDLRAGGHLGAVPDPGRGHRQLPGPGGRRRPASPTCRRSTTGVPESCSPMAFPAFGTQIDCATVTENPQTFYANQGPPKWETLQVRRAACTA